MTLRKLRGGAFPAALVLGALLIHLSASPGETRVERQPFAQFPAQVGAWQQVGSPERFDVKTEGVLSADDYMLRDFALADRTRVSLFSAYYDSTLHVSKDYHSPLVCLPGGGWAVKPQPKVRITPAGGGAAFDANHHLVSKGDQQLVMLYWYQGRGRFTAGEFWNKTYTLWDGLRRHRSDGALVRVTVPVVGTHEAALATAQEFAALAAPGLARFIPR
ncbi:MAG TPA: EpsI family protein [Pyrinomonadaceae bacterium]|nr:EpsI family protein [Pyrinomonadaceae bacterium]